MNATKLMYQPLVGESEHTLAQTKNLEAEAEPTLLESQRELQHSKSIPGSRSMPAEGYCSN